MGIDIGSTHTKAVFELDFADEDTGIFTAEFGSMSPTRAGDQTLSIFHYNNDEKLLCGEEVWKLIRTDELHADEPITNAKLFLYADHEQNDHEKDLLARKLRRGGKGEISELYADYIARLIDAVTLSAVELYTEDIPDEVKAAMGDFIRGLPFTVSFCTPDQQKEGINKCFVDAARKHGAYDAFVVSEAISMFHYRLLEEQTLNIVRKHGLKVRHPKATWR